MFFSAGMRVDDVTADPAKEGRKMKEVVLSSGTGRFEEALVAEVTRIKTQKVKIYSTTVYPPNPGPVPEHFVTTSKDIHLRLGQMSEEARWSLACLIQESLDGVGDGLLIFEDEGKHGALFATVVLNEEDKDLIIHLSLAN